MFKKIFYSLFVCLILVGCSNEPVFNDTQGNAIQLNKLKGKWVIVNYWAPWCLSCVKEIPELNKFYKKMDESTLLYGISYDSQTRDELIQQAKNLKMTYPILTTDPNQAWHLSTIDFVPTTFIINPKGKVVKEIIGPTSEKSLKYELAELQK